MAVVSSGIFWLSVPRSGAWTWLLVGYGLLFMTLVFYAGHVALFDSDKQRRADAFKVLKLVWGAAGVTNLLGIILRLSQIGVL